MARSSGEILLLFGIAVTCFLVGLQAGNWRGSANSNAGIHERIARLEQLPNRPICCQTEAKPTVQTSLRDTVMTPALNRIQDIGLVQRGISLSNLHCRGVENSKVQKSGYFDTLYVRKTTTQVPFWISTHPLEYDELRHRIFKEGTYYEYWVTHLIETLVPAGTKSGYVMDVGANVGWISLVAAARGARTLSFEPNPRNIQRLCQSIAFNNFDHMEVFPMGISNVEGEFFFWEAPNPGASEITLTRKTRNDLKVQVETLDSILAKRKLLQSSEDQVYLLKIDVEGAESRVLEGASGLLSRHVVKAVVMEWSQQAGMRRHLEKCHSVMTSHGYKLSGVMYTANFTRYLTKEEKEQAYKSFDNALHVCNSKHVDGHCNVYYTID